MIMMIIVIIIRTIVIIIVSWELVVYDQVEHDFIRISTFFFSMRFICDIKWKSRISVMQSILSTVLPKIFSALEHCKQNLATFKQHQKKFHLINPFGTEKFFRSQNFFKLWISITSETQVQSISRLTEYSFNKVLVNIQFTA